MAKARAGRGVRLVGTVRRNRTALLVSTALQASVLLVLAMPAQAQAPNARPQGGVVSAGAATISQTTNNTLVTQGSQRAAVDWQSFDVGSSHSVTFQQPNAGAVILNRVNTPNPSQIAGRITANGQVIIENRSGVVFANGAQIEAHSLVVTAAGITNDKFMTGNMSFDIPARPNAQIVNRGRITVKQTGLAALVAPSVVNAGVIEAKLGHVVLAGASTHTVDLYGDGLLSVDVTSQVKQAPVGADGKPVEALVTNIGTIAAQGGTVLLTAQAADGIVSHLVEAGGRISADTVGTQAGLVRIEGVGGSITIEGAVSAAGRAPGTKGGQIELAATGTVTVASSARVSASGRAGGGNVAVGTTLARTAGGATVTPAMTAQHTVVQKGAKITADATKRGDGGRVTVLSTRQTTMAGTISARAGKQGGNGGFVEVSGDQGYALTGAINVSAAKGAAGTILIDPQDLTIKKNGHDDSLVTVTGTTDATLDVGNNGGSPTAVSATIDPGVFNTLIGNVTLQASRDLTVASAFSSPAANLALEAGRNLTVNAPITLTGTGTITLAAAVATPAFTAAAGYDAAGGPNGVLTIAAAGGLSASSGSVALSSGAGGVAINGTISAANLQVNVSAGGLLSVGAAVHATTANLNAGRIAIPAKVSGTSISANTIGGGTIDITGTVAATGTLSLTAGTNITASGVLSAGTLTGSGATAAMNGNNTITTLGAFTTTGNMALTTGPTLTVLGTVSVGGVAAPNVGNTGTLGLTVTGGDLVLGQAGGAAGVLNAGTLLLAATGAIRQPNGAIGANSLRIGTAASVSLPSASNLIAALGPVTTSGDFSLTDAISLVVQAPIVMTGAGQSLTLRSGDVLSVAATSGLAVDGDIVLQAQPPLAGAGMGSLDLQAAVTSNHGNVFLLAGAPGVNANAPVATGAGKLLSIVGDVLTHAAPATNTLNATATGTLEIAPFSNTGTVTLGAGAGLSLASLTGVTAGTLRVGAATAPGASSAGTTAAAITVSGFDAAGLTVLELDTSGAVTQTGALTNVARLTGQAGSVALAMAGNTVGTLGGFAVTGDFVLASNQDLTVLGTVQAGAAATIGLAANGALTIGQAGTAGVLNAGTVALVASGAISEPNGSIVATALSGPNAGTTFTQASSATLDGSNTISVLGAFTTAGDFALRNTQGLTVLGTVSAGGVSAPNPANTASLGLTVNGDLAIGQAGTAGVLNAGTVALVASGTITEPNGSIRANLLTGPNAAAAFMQAASATLNGANAIGALGSFVTAGNFALTDSQGLAILGTVSAGGVAAPNPANTASLGLTVNGDLAIGQAGTAGVLNAGTVVLVASGTISEPNGSIHANLLTGPNAAAAFTQAASAALNGANAIGTLGSFVTAGNFALTDTQGLTVLGTVSAGGVAAPNAANTASLGLTVNGDLAIGQAGTAGVLNAGTVALVASGAITEPNGSIRANLLTGPTTGAAFTQAASATLNGTNAVGALGSFVTTGNFALTDSQGLTILGTVSAGGVAAPNAANTASLGLTVNGDLVIGQAGTAGVLNAGTVALVASGTISEPNGSIHANLLTGPTTGAAFTQAASATLNGANAIGTLGSFVTTGNFALTDSQGLAILGTVSAGGVAAPNAANTASLGLTVNGDLAIGQAGTAGVLNAGTVALVASGAISEPNGSINANLLTGPNAAAAFTQAASATLNGANAIGALGSFVTAGNFGLTDSQGLAILGTVSAGGVAAPNPANTASLGLTVNGDLAIGQAGTAGVLNAGTVALVASGAISEPNGSIHANLLTGPNAAAAFTQAASATLNGTNAIATLGSFVTAGNFALTDSQGLAILGTVSAGGVAAPNPANTASLGLTVNGDLVIGQAGTAGVLNAGTVALVASGAISEPNGSINANLLTGPNAAAAFTRAASAMLNGSNAIGALGSFATNGNFALTDSQGLAILGTVSAGGVAAPNAANTASLGLTVNGDLAIGQAGTAGVLNAGTVALVASGAITEPNGSINANLLTGPTTGAAFVQAASAALNGANAIGVLGSFVTAGNFALTDNQGLTILGTVSAGGVAAPNVGNTGTLGLTVTGGDLVLGQAGGAAGVLNAGTLLLAATGAIRQPNGAIGANSLRIGTAASVSLPSASNLIAALGPVTTSGDFSLTDAISLVVQAPIVMTGAGQSLTLRSGDVLSVAATSGLAVDGDIVLQAQPPLAGAGTGSLDLQAAVTSNHGNVFLLAGAPGVNANAPVATGAGKLLSIVGDVLTHAAPATNTLNATATGTLEIAPFSNTGTVTLGAGSGLSLASLTGVTAGTLRVGAATAPGASSATTTAAAITVSGFDAAGLTLLELDTSGAVTQTGALTNVARLTGQAGSVALAMAGNTVGTLGGFAVTGDFVLASDQDLTVLGTVQAGAAATIGLVANGALAIGQAGTAGVLHAGTVSLVASGAISEPNGSIHANLLIGPTTGAAFAQASSATLDGSNTISVLGAFTTAGDFALRNTQGLTVLGTVSAGGVSAPSVANTASLGLTVNGDLAIGQAGTAGVLNAGTVALVASGTISEPNGSIHANLLTGPNAAASFTQATSATLNGTNAIGALGSFVTAGNFALTDSQGLTILGTVSAGGVTAPNPANTASLGLTVNGDLAIGQAGTAGVLNAGTVALVASGMISEPNGSIHANLLTGPNAAAAFTQAASAALNGANAIGTLGSFVTAGNFALTDSQGLTVLGTVSAGGVSAPNAANTASLGLTVNGDLAIGQAGTAGVLNAGTVALVASGTISEPNGSINANLLTGPTTGAAFASAASATLNGANAIGALGSFVTAGNFALTDSQGLTILGTVSAGGVAAPNPANTAGLGLTVNGDLAIGQPGTAGSLNAGTIVLMASGAISEPNGSIHANLLTGPTTGAAFASAASATLNGANAIGALGSFVTAGNFALTDSQGLTILGTVSAGGVTAPNPANTASLGLTVNGDLAIGQAGTAGVLNAGTVALVVSGAISEPNGSINANLLTGPTAGAAFASATSATLNGANAIGALGSFVTTGNFALTDSQGLTILGTVSAGGVAAPNPANTASLGLTVNGDLAIGQAGTAGVLNAGTVALVASGAITEPNGSIHANLLTGPATGAAFAQAASATLNGANAIGALGSFVTAGNFALTDSQGLTILGTVSAGGVAAPNPANTASLGLTVDGDLAIGQAGTAGSLNAGTIVLMASGAITEPNGTINANLLTGPSPGATFTSAASATLNGSNAIAGLGAFVAAGDFMLADSRGLTILGGVFAGGVPAPNPANTASLGLTVNGDLTIGQAGTAGALTAGTVALVASGDITEPNGTIAANVLTGPAGGAAFTSANSATLDSATNRISLLGPFNVAAGDFILQNGVDLTIGGPVVAAGNVAITEHGALAVNGSVQAGNGIAITGDRAIAQNSGTISGAGTGVTLTALAGDITQAVGATIAATGSGNVAVTASAGIGFGGSIIAQGGTVALAAQGGAITETVGATPTGIVSANTLTGAATGTVAFDNSTGNAVTTLGPFAAGGSFTLVNQQDLALAGAITAGSGIMLSSAGSVSQDAGSSLGTTGAIRISALGAFRQAASGDITAGGAAGLIDIATTTGISAGGALNATGAGGRVQLATHGSIDQTSAPGAGGNTGRLNATRLDIAAGDSVALDSVAGGGNHIGTLDAASAAAGDLTLSNAQDLVIVGPARAGGGIAISAAGDLTVAAGTLILGGTAASLTAGLNLTQAAGGLVAAPNVTITAPGTIAVAGTLQGTKIVISGPGGSLSGQVTLANGAAFATGSAGQFVGQQVFAHLPTSGTATAGTYISTVGLTQIGNASVTGLHGVGSPTFRIDTSGNVAFDRAGGLTARTTTLILNILGAGAVTGQVFIQGLYVNYPVGTAGSIDLVGSVGDVGGQPAAQVSFIAPMQNANFRFNSCPIGSTNCIVLSVLGVPITNPTQDVDIRTLRDQQDDPDILLPNVSDKDY
ncbi:filamentous hemagglutinin N-terminal domain-containing protein [Limobrevibacterium gyesilva]|uniref:Filamentous hemagglutinin N-terminal domain-containing protein n=1 Tax=Limobrevibacterium gyesilva TaxID=2991712 RepID=A0AA41YI31_9PROT|nr:filamentous hemagglutinin N-terminal domain-containing protein [Limobrevibacterium gyesilva]MCW3473886.1 filamentous hemagglutinin N-terminal domain-containing protein [Limobrevibacterium gyesilva]